MTVIKYQDKHYFDMSEITTAVQIAVGDDGHKAKEVQEILEQFIQEGLKVTGSRFTEYTREEQEQLLYDSNPGLGYTREEYSKMSDSTLWDIWDSTEMDSHLDRMEREGDLN